MKIKNILLICTALFICANSIYGQTIAKYIPAEASMVFTVHPKNIDDKVALAKLQKFDFYDSSIKEMAASFKSEYKDLLYEALKEPSKYGMDFMSDYFFFVEKKEEVTYMSYLFQLNDQNKFGDFVGKMLADNGAEVVDKKSYKSIFMDGSSMVWNKEVALFTAASATVEEEIEPVYDDYEIEEDTEIEFDVEIEEEEMEEDVEYEIEEEEYVYEEEEDNEISNYFEELAKAEEEKAAKKIAIEKAAIEAYIPKLMYKKGSGSLIKNKSFSKAFVSKHDANLWMDYEAYMENQLGSTPMVGEMMGNLSDMYKDLYMSMDFDFNDGQMDMNAVYTGNDQMNKMWTDVMGNSFNKRFAKYIKGKDLMGMFGLSYNFEKGIKIMEDAINPNGAQSAGQMASEQLMAFGINIDAENIYNLFQGDMVFALTGMRTFEKMITTLDYDDDFNQIEKETLSKQTLPEFVMMMTYNNEADLNKFFDAGISNAMITKNGNYFDVAMPDMPMDLHMARHKGVLMVTNDIDLVTKNLKRGVPRSKRLSKEKCKALKNSASVFFWDMNKTMEMTEQLGVLEGAPASAKKVMEATKGTFNELAFQGSFDDTNQFSYKGNMSFKNKDMNALEQFFTYINEVYFHAIGVISM